VSLFHFGYSKLIWKAIQVLAWALGCSLAAVLDGFVAYGYDQVDVYLNHFLGFTGGWVDC